MSSDRRPGLLVVDTTQPLVLYVSGHITRADAPGLCADLERRLVGLDPADVVCDVGALAQADLAVVDALARLRLTAGRLGHTLRFRGAGRELRLLLALVGLDETVV
ncbi:STAS domain-containing protein [Streptomyces sp. NPDC048629]|uniref:STAS domain-containing protein n=1 Tax=Streptomyces sp. NPDC048629 TaxID=3154824 RepID=UPI00343B5DAB